MQWGKKIREIAGFIPNPLRFHEKTESKGRKFVKTGTGKNRGFREHCGMLFNAGKPPERHRHKKTLFNDFLESCMI